MSRFAPLLMRVVLLVLIALAGAACGRGRTEPTATPSPAPQVQAAPQAQPEATPTPVPTPIPTPVEPKASPTPIDPDKTVTTAGGVQYTELATGSGPKPEPGQVVAVHYTGTLENGTVFDTTEGGEPIRFALGTGTVIPGWDEGIALMHQGSKGILVIPPAMAYGDQGSGEIIPPNATLIFDVELVEISEGAPEQPTQVDAASFITTPQGLQYADLIVGAGPTPMPGQVVVVHYTGWLADGGKFASSLDRGEPLMFNLGMGQVIAGWDLGIKGMAVGGKRQLMIPPNLAYGEAGAEGVIPPNATLIFDVELLELR